MDKNAESVRYRFGAYELRPAAGELSKLGVRLKLRAQAFRLLVLLVERHGELVTREELRSALWGQGHNVEFDQGLNHCIREIRTVLCEAAQDPQFLETVPKRGYRFVAEVTAESAENPAGVAESPTGRGLGWWRFAAASIAIITLAGLLLSLRWREEAPAQRRAILIRPFVALGMPEERRWFAEALTQQLTVELARTRGTRVVPWTMALATQGQPWNLKELGQRFGVDSVVEGSVRESEGRIRIRTEMTDVPSEQIVWSHEDERPSGDLRGAEADILAALSAALRYRLETSGRAHSQRRPEDGETYALYLRASLMAEQFSAESTKRSIEYFNELIVRAPWFAPAYAGLANAQSVQYPTGKESTVKPMLDAESAARKALALDPSLAEAHAALGHALARRWQWKEADREYRTALDLDPHRATTHQLYGIYLATVGRIAEAEREARRAVELAPVSGLAAVSLGIVLLHAGMYEESVNQCRRAQEVAPHHPLAYLTMARALSLAGKPREAEAVIEEWERFAPEPVVPLWKARTAAAAGETALARKLVKEWRLTNPRAAKPPLALAAALVAVGDKEEAAASIELSVAERVPSIAWLKSAPELAGLRDEPRFKAAIARLNLQ